MPWVLCCAVLDTRWKKDIINYYYYYYNYVPSHLYEDIKDRIILVVRLLTFLQATLNYVCICLDIVCEMFCQRSKDGDEIDDKETNDRGTYRPGGGTQR